MTTMKTRQSSTTPKTHAKYDPPNGGARRMSARIASVLNEVGTPEGAAAVHTIAPAPASMAMPV